MATPAGLAVALAAIGFGVYALTRPTRRREGPPAPSPPPGAPPAPQGPPVPVPVPAPPPDRPTTTARIWYPLYRTDSVVVSSTRELRGWFQGPSERALLVEQQLAADRASRATSLGTTWSTEPGQLNQPDMTGLTPYITYRTTTVTFPPGTRREEIGITWARLEDANSLSQSLGSEWELRAWLGPLP